MIRMVISYTNDDELDRQVLLDMTSNKKYMIHFNKKSKK